MKDILLTNLPSNFSRWRTRPQSLETEALSVSNQNNFTCTQCLKSFSSKHCLKEHRFTHTNERPYSCNRCNKKFKHASQLSVHKKIHKIKAEIKWPTLTELLKFEKKKLFKLEFMEVIHLPPLGVTQKSWLPLHKGLENRL